MNLGLTRTSRRLSGTHSVVRLNQSNAVSHTICRLCDPRRRFPVVLLSSRPKRESELQDCSCVLTQEKYPEEKEEAEEEEEAGGRA